MTAPDRSTNPTTAARCQTVGSSASGFSIGSVDPSSNVGEPESPADASAVPLTRATTASRQRRESSRPSGTTKRSKPIGSTRPGSQIQLSTHAASRPAGSDPG